MESGNVQVIWLPSELGFFSYLRLRLAGDFGIVEVGL